MLSCLIIGLLAICAGTIFRLGEQILVKYINEDNQIQNITLCNMYFSKKVYGVQRGQRQSHRSWGVFENFCVTSNLTVCNL